MKNSEVLRKARSTIEWGNERYVCLAIENTYGAYESQIKGLRVWIRGLLEGYYTLEYWLEFRHGIDTDEGLTCAQSDRKMRATRLEWMTWMIAYWEARGQ